MELYYSNRKVNIAAAILRRMASLKITCETKILEGNSCVTWRYHSPEAGGFEKWSLAQKN